MLHSMTTKPLSPSSPTGRAAVDLPRAFTSSAYASLRTFKRDGSPVDCPIWFAWSDDGRTIWFRSKTDTMKVRRLRRDERIELRPSNWRGAVRADAPVLVGVARVLNDGDAEARDAEIHLHRRYGWQWYTMPLFRIPGTHTVKLDLSLLDKIRIIRAKRPLPDSSLVGISLASTQG